MPQLLFPEDDKTPITIKQGRTGDCYLLVALDCILNAQKNGRDVLKKIFKENPDGSVSIRIKKTEQSKFLKKRPFKCEVQF